MNSVGSNNLNLIYQMSSGCNDMGIHKLVCKFLPGELSLK